MITIFEGDAAHISSIMPIMENAFDPAFGESWTAAQCLSALAMPGSRMLIASLDGTRCGFTLSRWVLDSEELLMIGVAKEVQRQAIGATLLNEVVRLAKNAGRTELFIEVRDGNPAQIFYANCGFQPIGRRKEYYKGLNGDRIDAITMIMTITDSCK